MTRLSIVAALLLSMGSAVAAPDDRVEPVPSEQAAVTFVQQFFAAFDARVTRALGDAFLPDAKIVHDNGVVTTIPKMLEIVRAAKDWPPRERQLSEFEFTRAGNSLVVGCLNSVRFAPVGRDPVEYRYRETWVLVSTDKGLRAARSHYSLVTQEEHSEDVP